MNKAKYVLIVTALLTATGLFSIDLVKNNCSEYVIVLPDQSIAAERYAAKELSDYICKATGIYLSGTTTPSPTAPQIILQPEKSYAPEEFSIQVKGKNLIISGGRTRGILYGVYEFLEKFVGCRWFAPDCEYVPELSVLTIDDTVNLRRKPSFMYRDVYSFPSNFPLPRYTDYRARNKLNLPFHLEARHGYAEIPGSPSAAHTYLRYSSDFPLEICWMNEHGKRIQVKNTTDGQICYSHPEVRRRFAEKLRAYIETDRKAAAAANRAYPTIYDMSANDRNVPCFCQPCQALKEKHGVSGMVIDFTNAVARTIEKDYPDVLVQFFAYKDAKFPPKSNIKCNDNVMVRFAYMAHDILRPLHGKGNYDYILRLEQWSKVAKNISVWDYWKIYFDTYPSPKTGITKIADYFRHYRDRGVRSIFVECEVTGEEPDSFVELRNYVMAKLLDNPDHDQDKLIDEFMQHYYGKASATMKEYLLFLERSTDAMPERFRDVFISNRSYLTEDFFKQANKLLDKAESMVPNDKKAWEHIQLERLPVDLAWLNKINYFKLNPNGKECKARLNRVFNALDIFGRKFYSNNYYKKNRKRLQALHQACLFRPALPAKFNNKTVVDFCWTDFPQSALVDDADAAGGKAFSISKRTKPTKQLHARELIMSVYDAKGNPQYPASLKIDKKDIPQDEKFHWYYAGRMKVRPKAIAIVHWTWLMSVQLGKAVDPADLDAEFDVYFSIKCQGPSYVKNSKLPDDMRWDRLVLVKLSDGNIK